MQTDYNAKYWRSRSVRRNAENKELKKRIKELKAGRENWKRKYMLNRDRLLKVEKELNFIKKTIGKIIF
ncbi:hypothetical protein KAI04_05255 [Candidatus Pacearchaeota archaeon]|nr:hypothetical protein [Candidatus Pacearchaeota archaeon]